MKEEVTTEPAKKIDIKAKMIEKYLFDKVDRLLTCLAWKPV